LISVLAIAEVIDELILFVDRRVEERGEGAVVHHGEAQVQAATRSVPAGTELVAEPFEAHRRREIVSCNAGDTDGSATGGFLLAEAALEL
jgi:hypothetical protein